MTEWLNVRQEFNPDGALRDVYIAPASVSLWNNFIAWVEGASYRTEFWHGQAKKELPHEFQEIKHLQLTAPTTLKLCLSPGVQINCHFFTDEEIEMDIDPKEIQDTASFDSLLQFLRNVSVALKRRAKVTHENSPEEEIFVVDYKSE